jgi:hypothetical protein
LPNAIWLWRQDSTPADATAPPIAKRRRSVGLVLASFQIHMSNSPRSRAKSRAANEACAIVPFVGEARGLRLLFPFPSHV